LNSLKKKSTNFVQQTVGFRVTLKGNPFNAFSRNHTFDQFDTRYFIFPFLPRTK